MADKNEEKYLDQLLNSLTDEGEEEGSVVSEEAMAGASDIIQDFVMDDTPQETDDIMQGLALDDSSADSDMPVGLSQDEINDLMSGVFGSDEQEAGEDTLLSDAVLLDDEGTDMQADAGMDSGMGDIFALDEEFGGDSNNGGQGGMQADSADEPRISMPAQNLQPDYDEGILDLLGEINKGIEENAQQENEKLKKKKGLFGGLFGKKSSKDGDGAADSSDGDNKKAKKEKKKKKKKSKGGNGTQEQETSALSAQDNTDMINAIYNDDDADSDSSKASEEDDEEEEAPKKEKKKKEKKPKEPKPPKPPKPKKEKKAPRPSEMVKVSKGTFFGIILFTAIVVAALTVGTNILSYKSSVDTARRMFENKRYVKAFDSISGLDLKDEDKDIYFKIRTIMSLYSDYSSYDSYSKVGLMYEALDSLINGLYHYDDYYFYAVKYEVVTEYDEVMDLIVDTLASYGISKSDADYYRKLENEEQYKEILRNIGGSRH